MTLVEMLVVLAILGVLAALVLPLSGHTRSVARRVRCAGNLHQISVAYTGYRADKGMAADDILIDQGWESQLLPYLSGCKEALLCPEDKSPAFGLLTRADVAVYNRSTWLYDIDMRPKEGWVQKHVLDGHAYELWFEDMGTWGDGDFNDIVLRIEDQHDGMVLITVLSRSAAYHFDMIKQPDREVLISRLGEGGGNQQWRFASGRTSYGMNALAGRIPPRRKHHCGHGLRDHHRRCHRCRRLGRLDCMALRAPPIHICATRRPVQRALLRWCRQVDASLPD